MKTMFKSQELWDLVENGLEDTKLSRKMQWRCFSFRSTVRCHDCKKYGHKEIARWSKQTDEQKHVNLFSD